MASLLQHQNQYKEAIDAYSQTLKIAEEIGSNSKKMICYENLGVCLQNIAQYIESKNNHNKAVNIAKKLNDILHISNYYFNLGVISENKSDYVKAIDYFKQALTIKIEIKDTEGIFFCNLHMAAIHTVMRQFIEAEKYNDDLLTIIKTEQKVEYSSKYYSSMGSLCVEKSNFSEGIKFHEKALEMYDKINDLRGIEFSYIELGKSYLKLQNIEKSLYLLLNALDIADEDGHIPGVIESLLNIGIIYCKLGRFTRSEESLFHAIRLASEYDHKKSEILGQIYLIDLYSSIGERYDAAYWTDLSTQGIEQNSLHFLKSKLDSRIVGMFPDNYEEAIADFNQGLKSARKYQDPEEESRCYLSLAEMYLQNNQVDAAIRYSDQAYEIIRKMNLKELEYRWLLIGGTVHNKLKDYQDAIKIYSLALDDAKFHNMRKDEMYCHYFLSINYMNIGEVDKARQHLDNSIYLIEKLGQNITNDEHKTSFYGQMTKVYNTKIESCIKSENFSESLEWIERSKSKAFLDILSSPTRISSNAHKITKLSTSHPPLQEPNTQNLSIDEMVDLIPKNSILVEYYVSEEILYIFILTDKLYVETKKISKEDLHQEVNDFIRNVDECFNAIQNNKKLPDEKIMYANLKRLGEILLEPIQNYLEKSQLVYFVPHVFLHFLPFHSLLLKNDKPLIRTNPVSYLPNFSILKVLKKQSTTKFETCSVFTASNENDDRIFVREINKEAENLSELFRTTIHKESTKEIALKQIEKQSDIVHISCHGVFNRSDPLYSGILFHCKKPNKNDFLSAREIFDLKLNTKLVTLSACDSGHSEVTSSDDLLGLTRVFFNAGASTIVASLWASDVTATTELMNEFYTTLKRINGSFKVASAMQKAQNILMDSKDHSHPYLWSSFIVFGNS